MSNLYMIPVQQPGQEELFKKHCFGDCKKISMAGVMDAGPEIGGCFICPQDECPYEKGRVDMKATSEWTGEPLFLRVLEEKQ